MSVLLYIFLASCFIILYNYAGYAMLAVILTRLFPVRRKKQERSAPFSVSFIVAAYNEEEEIKKKIQNCLSLDYPPDYIEYIFITDGSTDNTPELVASEPRVISLHLPERNGKSAAMNRAVPFAKGEILIFSDANTVLNKDAIHKITRHYATATTGGVAGEKKVIHPDQSGHEVGTGEGMYWRYESLLKKIDSACYSVVGAAGELFSVRKDLFQPLSSDVILDDFVSTLRIAQEGYQIIYEPDAYAMETPSFSIEDERKRKVRIAAGGFQSIVLLKGLLKFWKYPRLSFLYVSHRVLRWTLTPLCLPIAFLSNLALCFYPEYPVFKYLFAAQLLFYLLAFLPLPENRLKFLKLPGYFVFMNLSVYSGFFRFLKGTQSTSWEKARRAGGSHAFSNENSPAL